MAKVPAFFDANVLASMTLTDLVIECVHQGLFSARWSDKIHHEWMQAVLASIQAGRVPSSFAAAISWTATRRIASSPVTSN